MNTLLIQLLLGIGGSLGASFIQNPSLQKVVADAVVGAQGLVALLTNKSAGSVAGPAFITILQAAIKVLADEGRITAGEATALNDAITKTLAADQQGQQLVDPSTLTPIAPLP